MIQGNNQFLDVTDSSSALAEDKWTYVGLTVEYRASTGFTTVEAFYDRASVGVIYTGPFRVMDSEQSLAQYIGAEDNPPSNFYKGFIWRVSFYNAPFRDFGPGIRAPGCPSDLDDCLSSYPLFQTTRGDYCKPTCLHGCVRPSDCHLCRDALCDICPEVDTFACIQCHPTLMMITTCECDEGYYWNSAKDSCLPCDSTCVACATATFCTKCHMNASVDISGKCKCKDSRYPDPTSSNCSSCSEECLTCLSSASACTSCRANAQLSGSTCFCSPGYYGTPSHCQACSRYCLHCKENVCEQCYPGYFNVQGVCSLHCPRGFSEDLNIFVCMPLPNSFEDVIVIAEVNELNILTLNFSHAVQPKLTLEDLVLELTDSDSVAYRLNTDLNEIQANQSFALNLTVEGGFLPANNELTIAFLHPEVFTDDLGNHLINTVLFVTLHPLGLESRNTSLLTSVTRAAVAGSMAGGATVSLLSGSPTTFFSLLNNAQMLTYLPLSTIPLPASLKQQLIGMNIQSIFENPFPEASSGADIDKAPPQFAQDYGFSDCSFLSNANIVLASALLNLGSLLIVWVLAKTARVGLHFQKLLEGYRWRNLVMHWILSYLDLSIAAYLQLLQLSFTSGLESLASLLGCFVATFSVIFPFALLYRCLNDHSCFPSSGPWCFLYADLKNNKGWLSSAYYVLFLFRRLLYSLALVFLSSYPLLQSLLFYCHSLLVSFTQTVLYLIVYRPIASRLDSITITVSESAIGIVFSLAIAFNFSLSEGTFNLIVAASTVCIYIAVAIPAVTGAISLYFKVKDILKLFMQAKCEVRPSLGLSVTQPYPEDPLTFRPEVIRASRPMETYAQASNK